MRGDLFQSLLDSVDAADDQWQRDTDRLGIICGHRRRCTLLGAVLLTLASDLADRGGAYFSQHDLGDLAKELFERQNDEIDALRARVQRETQAAQGEGQP